MPQHQFEVHLTESRLFISFSFVISGENIDFSQRFCCFHFGITNRDGQFEITNRDGHFGITTRDGHFGITNRDGHFVDYL